MINCSFPGCHPFGIGVASRVFQRPERRCPVGERHKAMKNQASVAIDFDHSFGTTVAVSPTERSNSDDGFSADIDTVLPTQFFDGAPAVERLSGARGLMLAILEDAIACLEGTSGGNDLERRRLAVQAEAWIRAEDSDWPCSFDNVCLALSLEPVPLRRRLLKRRRESADHPRSRRRRRVKAPFRFKRMTAMAATAS